MLLMKRVGQVPSQVLQLIKYAHHGLKKYLAIFSIPEVIRNVRALKLQIIGPFNGLLDIIDMFI